MTGRRHSHSPRNTTSTNGRRPAALGATRATAKGPRGVFMQARRQRSETVPTMQLREAFCDFAVPRAISTRRPYPPTRHTRRATSASGSIDIAALRKRHVSDRMHPGRAAQGIEAHAETRRDLPGGYATATVGGWPLIAQIPGASQRQAGVFSASPEPKPLGFSVLQAYAAEQ